MAAALDEPAVELHDLGRDYGERVALRDVTITVPAGATLAVLGPNGAGKSTLLRVLATLLRPHRGRVRVLGRDVPGEGWAVRARLGLLAHEPLLYRDLSGRENLRYQARLFGIDVVREHVHGDLAPARGDLASCDDLQTDAFSFRARGRNAAHRIVISERDPIETRLGGVAYDERRLERAVGYIGMGVQVVSRQTRSRR